MNYYDLLKFVTSLWDGHCSSSSRAWKGLATPLMGGEFVISELNRNLLHNTYTCCSEIPRLCRRIEYLNY